MLTAFTNPVFTFEYAVLDPDKALFLAQLLVPLMALPLVAGLGPWLIVLPAWPRFCSRHTAASTRWTPTILPS